MKIEYKWKGVSIKINNHPIFFKARLLLQLVGIIHSLRQCLGYIFDIILINSWLSPRPIPKTETSLSTSSNKSGKSIQKILQVWVRICRYLHTLLYLQLSVILHWMFLVFKASSSMKSSHPAAQCLRVTFTEASILCLKLIIFVA